MDESMFLGYWIRPWPGEPVVGVACAVSGQNLVCKTSGGFRFEIPLVKVSWDMVVRMADGRHRTAAIA